jgi:hypothetical protein
VNAACQPRITCGILAQAVLLLYCSRQRASSRSQGWQRIRQTAARLRSILCRGRLQTRKDRLQRYEDHLGDYRRCSCHKLQSPGSRQVPHLRACGGQQRAGAIHDCCGSRTLSCDTLANTSCRSLRRVQATLIAIVNNRKL